MRTLSGIDELRGLKGQEIAVSEWWTITQEMIDQFAVLTGDPQWIHEDTERTRRESPFGGPIAHGFLTLSLISPLRKTALQIAGDHKMGVNYGFERVRFVAPVPSGARIRGRYGLKSLRDIDGGYEIGWSVHIEIEGGSKPALVCDWLTRVYV